MPQDRNVLQSLSVYQSILESNVRPSEKKNQGFGVTQSKYRPQNDQNAVSGTLRELCINKCKMITSPYY